MGCQQTKMYCPCKLLVYDTHFTEGSSINQKFDINEFEEMHANQLEYHILGLKCRNFSNSVIECFSNPFYVEFTSKEFVDLNVVLKNDKNLTEKNVALIQKEKCKNEYKYCVIFYVNKKESRYPLSLFNKDY